MDKLHPMNETKKLDKAIETATLEELTEAQSSFRYSSRHATRIAARIAKLAPKDYTGETEANDAWF